MGALNFFRSLASAFIVAVLGAILLAGLGVAPERGGRAKRFFQVTPQGMRAVKETQRALVALWKGVPQLKGGPV